MLGGTEIEAALSVLVRKDEVSPSILAPKPLELDNLPMLLDCDKKDGLIP
jgi:hypothetical protein